MPKVEEVELKPRSYLSMLAAGVSAISAVGVAIIMGGGAYMVDPYPTVEQLRQTSGKKVVLMEDMYEADSAAGYCRELGLEVGVDPNGTDVGIGCVGSRRDMDPGIFSVSEQIDACRDAGGILNNVTTDRSDPFNTDKLAWVCLVPRT